MAADSTAGDDSTAEETENEMDMCAGCGQRITDRFMLQIKDEAWHERCAVCKECGTGLQGSCFLRNGILLCRNHYTKLYGARCSRCLQPIVANEVIMRALTNVYHARCFGCMACDRPLRKGDHFVLRGGLPLCRSDFERERLDDEEDDDEEVVADSDSDVELNREGVLEGSASGKRPRTVLTAPQRRRLRAVFEADAKPNRRTRERLAAETGVSARVVQVWFQNQRAKAKKLEKGGFKESRERIGIGCVF